VNLLPIDYLAVVHIKQPGKPGWTMEPCEEWYGHRLGRDGHDQWRDFKAGPAHVPDAAAWEALWAAAEAAVPWATVAVGARLSGDRRHVTVAAERWPGLLMLSLHDRAPGPFSLLMHEALHEVWDRLDEAEQDVLVEYGQTVRQANAEQGGVYPADWFDRPGEAEAVSFAGWCMGAKDCMNLPHSREVVEVWNRIRNGKA